VGLRPSNTVATCTSLKGELHGQKKLSNVTEKICRKRVVLKHTITSYPQITNFSEWHRW